MTNPVQRKIDESDFLRKKLALGGSVRIGRIGEVFAGAGTAQVNTGESTCLAVWGKSVNSTQTPNNDISIPIPGSLALIYTPPEGIAVIICSVPPESSSEPLFFRNLLGSGINIQTEQQNWAAVKNNPLIRVHSGIVDALSGDQGWRTEDDSAVASFRGGISSIKGSELAQMQCISIDDMVRIISRNYEHFSDFGEYRISNDNGRLTIELLGTSKEDEAKGAQGLKDILKEKEEEDSPTGDLRIDSQYATGRWRLKLHIGYLGDQLHMWITKPPDVEMLKEGLDSILDKASQESGVAELFIGSDGTLKVRSVREIISQKVKKIRIPIKKKEAWQREPAEPPPTSQLVQFQENTTHPSAKHLTKDERDNYHAQKYEIKRYLEHEQEWKIQKEEETSLPITEQGETAFLLDATSTIHQREDGSIYLEARPRKPITWEAEWPEGISATDGLCSSIELTADGDIKLSAARDIFLEAGRNVTSLGSQDIIMRGRQHIDLSAAQQDVRIKAEGSVQLRAQQKAVIIESDAIDAEPVDGVGEVANPRGISIKCPNAAPIYIASGGPRVAGKIGSYCREWRGGHAFKLYGTIFVDGGVHASGFIGGNNIPCLSPAPWTPVPAITGYATWSGDTFWPMPFWMERVKFSFRPPAEYRWNSRFYQTKAQFLANWTQNWDLLTAEQITGTTPWPGLAFNQRVVYLLPPAVIPEPQPQGSFNNVSTYSVRR